MLRYLKLITVVGLTIALTAFAGALVGSAVDRRLGTGLFVPSLTVVGVAFGYYMVWKYIEGVPPRVARRSTPRKGARPD